MDRSIRTYHARGGRSQPKAARAVTELLPRYGVSPSGDPLTPSELFDPPLPAVVEFGSGMGDATATMATDDPATGIIAVEVHTPGVGRLLRRIDNAGLANVRVVHGDGVLFLHERVPPGSLAGFRCFFPDPWPKKKHHKRRLIQPELVRLIVSRLASGAAVHLATDWADYAEQMIEVVTAEPDLDVVFTGAGDCPLPRPETKFEAKGKAKGHQICDIVAYRS